MTLNLWKCFTVKIFLMILILHTAGWSQGHTAPGNPSIVSFLKGDNNFILSASGTSAPLVVHAQEYPGVVRVLRLLQADIEKVTAVRPLLSVDSIPRGKEIVLVGTLGKSPWIDELVKNKKIDVRYDRGEMGDIQYSSGRKTVWFYRPGVGHCWER